MIIKAHCFAKEVKIEPPSFQFNFKKFVTEIYCLKVDKSDKSVLQISRKLTESELEHFKIINKSEEIVRKRVREYKEYLTEIAHLVEGVFSILYVTIPPRFDTDVVSVNLLPEDEKEKQLFASNELTKGFGAAELIKKTPTYKIDKSIQAIIEPASKHLPALSFFTQAARSLERNDNEVAFFLYFRIIDGYFSDGAKDVEKALHKKEDKLKKYFKYEEHIKETTKLILNEMELESKSHKDYKGLISDIVLIRHKLTHFSSTHAHRHHSPRIKFELKTLNKYLHKGLTMFLSEKIKVG